MKSLVAADRANFSNAQTRSQFTLNLGQIQQALNDLGLVIIDTKGQIQWVTPQAIQWLEVYCSTSIASLQLPDHLWGWVRYQVASLPQAVDPSVSRFPLRIQQAGKQLVIRLVSHQAGELYLLLLEEQPLSVKPPLELLGLSQREAEVLEWVMRGKDNRAIAKQLDVNISTVRKHLESIYRKLNVQSRTEAIAQVLIWLGVLDALP